jgi:hypothetical protein
MVSKSSRIHQPFLERRRLEVFAEQFGELIVAIHVRMIGAEQNVDAARLPAVAQDASQPVDQDSSYSVNLSSL